MDGVSEWCIRRDISYVSHTVQSLKGTYGVWSIPSCEKVPYTLELGSRWERQYSLTAGKHMQQNMNMVLRCGEHSNGYMYVEHGAVLALERRAVVVV